MPPVPQIYPAFGVDSNSSIARASAYKLRAPSSSSLSKEEQAARRSLRYAKAEENLTRCLRSTWREPTHLQLQLSALRQAISTISVTVEDAKEALEKLRIVLGDSRRRANTDPEVYREMQRQRWREERRKEVAEDLLKTLNGYLDEPHHPIFIQTLYPPLVAQPAASGSGSVVQLNNPDQSQPLAGNDVNSTDAFTRLNLTSRGNEDISDVKADNLKLQVPEFIQSSGCRQYSFARRRHWTPLPPTSATSTPKNRLLAAGLNSSPSPARTLYSTTPFATPTKPNRSVHKHSKPLPLLLGTPAASSLALSARTTTAKGSKLSYKPGYKQPYQQPTGLSPLSYSTLSSSSLNASAPTPRTRPPISSAADINLRTIVEGSSSHDTARLYKSAAAAAAPTRRPRPGRAAPVEGTGTATIWIDPLWVEREFEVDEDEDGLDSDSLHRHPFYSRSPNPRMGHANRTKARMTKSSFNEDDSDTENHDGAKERVDASNDDTDAKAPLPDYAVQLLAEFASNSRAGRKSLDVRDLSLRPVPSFDSSADSHLRTKKSFGAPTPMSSPVKPIHSTTTMNSKTKLEKKRTSLINFSTSSFSSHGHSTSKLPTTQNKPSKLSSPFSVLSLSPLTAPPRPHHTSASSRQHHRTNTAPMPLSAPPTPRKRVSALLSLENITYRLGSGLGAVIPLGRVGNGKRLSAMARADNANGRTAMGPPVLPTPPPLTPMAVPGSGNPTTVTGGPGHLVIDEEDEEEMNNAEHRQRNVDHDEEQFKADPSNIPLPSTPISPSSPSKPRLSEASDFSFISIPSSMATAGPTTPPRTPNHSMSAFTTPRRPRPTPFSHADALLNRTPVKGGKAGGIFSSASTSSMRLGGGVNVYGGADAAGRDGGGEGVPPAGLSPSKMGIKRLKQRISVLGLRRN